ncbi:MAG TPA: TlpA disulfide reductase family protein [Tepidisphaeraceae bacterium]|nr:TlpA disulfide reductase family protein [Tepidisphaeraceae bacterium]
MTLATPSPNAMHLVYFRPKPFEPSRDGEEMAGATVVIYERPDEHPDGVWVGYGDGRLEFAATPGDLAECRGQLAIVKPLRKNATTMPAPTGGQMKLKILDPAGRPVAGALVGTFLLFNEPGYPPLCFYHNRKPHTFLSDKDGALTLPATEVFSVKFATEAAVPIYVFDQSFQLAARFDARRADFRDDEIHVIHLSPACQVHGHLSSVGLRALGGKMSWTNTIVFDPGQISLYTITCSSNSQTFDLALPPGDYGIDPYGTDCQGVHRYIHIAPGRREMSLELDLPPDRMAGLAGHPAPELRDIKGWDHGGPVKLADLHGKVVLLDFWGYWCGPCIGSMPALMKLYDQFKDKGLFVIAVHDDSVASIAEMDQKLASARETRWHGRDLPFLVALDGGGQTRIKYTADLTSGATTAAYGVDSFPSTVLIGRDGNVIGWFDIRAADATKKMAQVVDQSPTPQPANVR